MSGSILCSDCFSNEGIKLYAREIGIDDTSRCLNCNSKTGAKLSPDLIGSLAHRFFVWGTLQRFKYGAAPVVQFNDVQKTSIKIPPFLENDLHLIEKAIGVGFFYYGPNLWMVGEIEPLKSLQEPSERKALVDRVVTEYPKRLLAKGESFYRLRKEPKQPAEKSEYDSPPAGISGAGRIDSRDYPVMYGSQDIQICIHECRVAADDNIFMATLAPTRNLKLLDLTAIIREELTPFESLDMAVHMLFLAGDHSYEISRSIALAAREAGYDGLVYPSYFSLLRTGAMPFETVFGLPTRGIVKFEEQEKLKIIPNFALFGRPIEMGMVEVKCINRIILGHVNYGVLFGPVGHEPLEDE